MPFGERIGEPSICRSNPRALLQLEGFIGLIKRTPLQNSDDDKRERKESKKESVNPVEKANCSIQAALEIKSDFSHNIGIAEFVS